MPGGYAFEHRMRVSSQQAGQAANGLAIPGISLMWHRARAGLPCGERFLHFEYLSALQVAQLGRDALHTCAQKSQGVQEVGMAVAVDDLRACGIRCEAQPVANPLL